LKYPTIRGLASIPFPSAAKVLVENFDIKTIGELSQ
jgi:hypothetical protein